MSILTKLFRKNNSRQEFPVYKTIPELFAHHNQVQSDALFHLDHSGNTTRKALMQTAERIAANLFRMKASGKRIAMILDQDSQWLGTLMGIWLANGVAVPLRFSESGQHIVHRLRQADVSLVIHNVEDLEEELESNLPAKTRSVNLLSLLHATGRRGAGYLPSPSDDALVLFTAGTNNPARPVALTHQALCNGAQRLMRESVFDQKERFATTFDWEEPMGMFLSVLPALAGGYGLLSPLHSLRHHEVLSKHGATTLVTSPYHARQLYHDFRLEDNKSHVSSPLQRIAIDIKEAVKSFAKPKTMKNILFVGDTPCEELIQFCDKAHLQLFQGYGFTEAGGLTHLAAKAAPLQPLQGIQQRLAYPDRNSTGQLLLRLSTPWERLMDTENDHVDMDGWLNTGDLVTIDQKNGVTLFGQKAVALHNAAATIATRTFEQLLERFPFVEEAFVTTSELNGEQETTVRVYPDNRHFDHIQHENFSLARIEALVRSSAEAIAGHLGLATKIRDVAVAEEPFLRSYDGRIRRFRFMDA